MEAILKTIGFSCGILVVGYALYLIVKGGDDEDSS